MNRYDYQSIRMVNNKNNTQNHSFLYFFLVTDRKRYMLQQKENNNWDLSSENVISVSQSFGGICCKKIIILTHKGINWRWIQC